MSTETKKQKPARLVIVWDAGGIKVQSNGVTNPTAIAMLEMAKALMMQNTVGQGKRYEAGKATIQQAPTVLARQVDKPA